MKEYLQSSEEVLSALTTTENGLSGAEAQSRLEKNGKNKLVEGKKTPMIVRFFQQFAEPMTIILLVAAVISGIMAIFENEFPADVIIIMAVVVINAVLGVLQESKAEKAIAALQEITAATSKVIRDGHQQSIRSEDLAVGDIIVLDEFRGTVRNIGIRTTVIEDAGGNQKIVNNSDIRNLQNRSHNISVAVADIGICYEDRIEDVEKILIPALQDIYERNKNIYLAPPRYAGVEALADSAVVLRVVADVTEENIFVGRRTLNRELKILFDNNNIEIPFPQVVVHRGE